MMLTKRAEFLKIEDFPSLKVYLNQFELLHTLLIEKNGRLSSFTFKIFLKFFSLVKATKSPLVSILSKELLKNAEFVTNKAFIENLLILLRKFAFFDKNLLEFCVFHKEILRKEEIFTKELLPELWYFAENHDKSVEFVEFLRKMGEK